MPILFISFFSYVHSHQFATPLPQQGVLNVTEHLTALEHGWHYVDTTGEHMLAAIPSVLHTEEVTTFTVSLHMPQPAQTYSLQLEGIEQPFTLMINNEPIKQSVMFGTNQSISFYAEEQDVTLQIAVTPVHGRIAILQTPTIAQTDMMQRFILKELTVILFIFCFLLIISGHSLTLYILKQQSVLYLQISLYFLCISFALFLSSDGIYTTFMQLPPEHVMQLKTIAGLLTILPLYFIISYANRYIITKKTLLIFLGVLTLIMLSLFITPLDRYTALEIIIWIGLISVFFIYIVLLFAAFYRQQQLGEKNIVLLFALSYLLLYLSVRVYYNVYGLNFPAFLLLIVFVAFTSVYLVLHQRDIAMELEISKKEVLQSKLSFFNAQIKPHFIYNALSNIMALCYTDNMKAAHLLGKFSTYLRIIFENNDTNDFIPLKKELALVDAYIDIEKTRFSNHIHYTLHVDDVLLEQPIPPLSIQPFVENAVRHGLFTKADGGDVTVTIEEVKGQLIVTISDTGVGIDAQTLQAILQRTIDVGSIGITNVMQRLKLIPASTFSLQSTPQQGTHVRFTIPTNIR